MAQAYTRGSAHIWVGTGSGGTAQYLGTGERAPRVSIRKRFKDVPNDLAGETPYDYSYQGREGFVNVRLTRWNDPVLQAMENVIGVAGGVDAGGVDGIGNMGALMVTQGQAVPLWVMYSYAPAGVAPQAAFATMRNGWHFFAAFLEGPDEHEGGTDPATEGLVFHCVRLFNSATGAFSLFDRDMSGVTPIN